MLCYVNIGGFSYLLSIPLTMRAGAWFVIFPTVSPAPKTGPGAL